MEKVRIEVKSFRTRVGYETTNGKDEVDVGCETAVVSILGDRRSLECGMYILPGEIHLNSTKILLVVNGWNRLFTRMSEGSTKLGIQLFPSSFTHPSRIVWAPGKINARSTVL